MTEWDVSADGYRLVVEGGAIRGLAYDEWPYPWGDPRYAEARDVTALPSSVLLEPWKPLSGPLRLRRVPGSGPVPLPDGSPYAFIGLSDQLIWERCPCPWWHRLPLVGRYVHVDLP